MLSAQQALEMGLQMTGAKAAVMEKRQDSCEAMQKMPISQARIDHRTA
jgi:hypothetical protein